MAVCKRSNREYIRGLRQIQAIYYFFWAIFTGNWLASKRELEIMSGFAKPYKVQFAPTFWESYQRTFNIPDEVMPAIKEEFAKQFGEEAVYGEIEAQDFGLLLSRAAEIEMKAKARKEEKQKEAKHA